MPQHKRPFPHPPPPPPARPGPASKLSPSRFPVESSTKGNHKLSATGIPDDSTNHESALDHCFASAKPSKVRGDRCSLYERLSRINFRPARPSLAGGLVMFANSGPET